MLRLDARNWSLSLPKLSAEAVIISIFSVISFLGILQHEMWRDELQAWMLARDSTSLIDLYQNMLYERHPGLWHACLYGLTQIAHAPILMQLFHWLIAIAIVYLFVTFSPFSLWQKTLFPFGYYTFYEYALISRNYSLGVLFMFLFCTVFAQNRNRYILSAAMLALMANVNAYAFIVSFALSLLLFTSAYENWKSGRDSVKVSALLASLAILLAGWLASAWQMLRPLALTPSSVAMSQAVPTDFATQSFSILAVLEKMGSSLAAVWKSYIPVPALFRVDFWSHNFLMENSVLPSISGISLGDIIAAASSILLLFAAASLFRKDLSVLSVFVLGSLGIITFIFFFHSSEFLGAAPRHHGNLFFLLLVCLWLLIARHRSSRDQAPPQNSWGKRYRSRFLALVLGAQMVAGIYAISMDFKYPFSTGLETVRFIKNQGLEDLTFFGSRYREASVLSGYLDKAIYYPEMQEFGTFWTHSVPDISYEQLVQAIEAFVNTTRQEPVLLVLNKPLQINDFSQVSLAELVHFDVSIVDEERFYLYLCQPFES